MTRTFLRLTLGLALMVAPACDCGSPVHVDDVGGRSHVDAGSDARIIDAAGVEGVGADVVSVDADVADISSADLAIVDTGPMDAHPRDQSSLDNIVNDQGLATDLAAAVDQRVADSSIADQVTPDQSNPDQGGGDAPLSDLAVSVDAGVPDCATGGLCIRLTWDSSGGDLDLHLSKDDAAWCTDGACYWARCSQTAGEPIEWDGVLGRSAGDGVLYGDGLIGFGPEYLRIEQPVAGSYTLGVYFNPGTGSATPVRFTIYANGVEIDSGLRSLAPGEFWQWGDINISNGTVSTAEGQKLCGSGSWICTDAVDLCPAS